MNKKYLIAYAATLWFIVSTLFAPVFANWFTNVFDVDVISYNTGRIYDNTDDVNGYPITYYILGGVLFCGNGILAVIAWVKALNVNKV